MISPLLEQLMDGPQTAAQLSDALWWELDLVELVLAASVEDGDVHAEIDGTYWLAKELAPNQEQYGVAS